MRDADGWDAILEGIADTRSLAVELMLRLDASAAKVKTLKRVLGNSTKRSTKIGKRQRITLKHIDEIARRFKKGESRQDLAREFGCDVRQIGNYLEVARCGKAIRSALQQNDISATCCTYLQKTWGKDRIEAEFSFLLDHARSRSNFASKGKNGLITKNIIRDYEIERKRYMEQS